MFKVTNSSSLKWMQWSKCAPPPFTFLAVLILLQLQLPCLTVLINSQHE